MTKEFFEILANDDVEALRILIAQGFNPKYNNSQGLAFAAEQGKVNLVKYLIPLSDPEAQQSSALRRAAEHGQTECVRLLIPVSNPKESASIALRWSIKNNNIECVRLLIPVSDPDIGHGAPLRLALKEKHAEIAMLLIPETRIIGARLKMEKNNEFEQIMMLDALLQEIELKKKYPEARTQNTRNTL